MSFFRPYHFRARQDSENDMIGGALPSHSLPPQCRAPYRQGVPRPPTNFKISSVFVQRDQQRDGASSGPVPISATAAVPPRFRALIALERPKLAVTLDVVLTTPGNRPVVVALSMEANTQTPITTSALRGVLVDQLLAAAMAEASETIVRAPEQHPAAFRTEDGQTWFGPMPFEGALADKANRRAADAALIYEAATAVANRAPAVAVATEMGVSRAQAARYIRRARELGLLPPLPGKGQEK